MLNAAAINATPLNQGALNNTGFAFRLVESLVLSEELRSSFGFLLVRETLIILNPVTTVLQGTTSLSDGFDLTDANQATLLLRLVDSLHLTDASSLSIETVFRLAEELVFTEACSSVHQALEVISEALLILDSVDATLALFLAELLNLGDTVGLDSHAVASLLEAIYLGDAATGGVRLTTLIPETFHLSDSLSTSAQLITLIQENINFGGVINLPDGVFEAWVLNTETHAPWKYTNYPFNSFARVKNQYLALTDAGLYELGGPDDEGTQIDSTILTGLLNFGSKQQKSVPRVYVGYTAENDILFKTITTREGKKETNWYQLEKRTADDSTLTRGSIGRGLRSVYWQFEITNVDGSDFSLDQVKLTPMYLKRRV